MIALGRLALAGLLVAVCASPPAAGPRSPDPPPVATGRAAPLPTATPPAPRSAAPAPPRCPPDARCEAVAGAIDRIDPARLQDHLVALTAVGSRDPRHPGHARARAYITEQLGGLVHHGWRIETQRTTHRGIALENILFVLEGAPGAPPAAPRVLISAHYDSTANRTPGWRPEVDPAPGADDNATGTAALLELARVISETVRDQVRGRIVLAFFDGEELLYKGSAAYVASLARPYPFSAAINLDMVGFNPVADRLDLIWYLPHSAGLRDQVALANERYAIGVAPLVPLYAADGSTIMDAAPFGLAGIPSVALCQRYGGPDEAFPGNTTFHTVDDTPERITNPRLWVKASRLVLATALTLVLAE